MLFIILTLTFSVFLNPKLACSYVATALTLWFENMIPALFPFMIISGIIVRKGYSAKLSAPIAPMINRLFHLNATMCTTILLGFMFGFPLGAKTIAEEYRFGHLTKMQAQYLLAFCNNIGPIYMLSFVFPLFNMQKSLLIIHMGIPFLYGLILRYTIYRSMNVNSTVHSSVVTDTISAIDDAVSSACNAMLKLGGYMMFFILWNLPFTIYKIPTMRYLPLFFEINSGLSVMKPSSYLALIFITFSGLSCYAQTYTCIKETDLNFKSYCLHKCIQTVLASIIYGAFFVFSSS